MVRPPKATWRTLHQYRQDIASHRRMIRAAPKLRIVHYVRPGDVDECQYMMAQNYISHLFGALLDVPAYDDWVLSQDYNSVYRRYINNLRLIAYRDQDKSWLLKDQGHMLKPESLISMWPDARIVHIHRDPVDAMCSLFSLFRIIAGNTQTAERVKVRVMDREVPLWKRAIENMANCKRRWPSRVIDVTERELVKEPLAMVRRIYEYWSLPLSQAIEKRMMAWICVNRKHRHGAHCYTGPECESIGHMTRVTFADYRHDMGFVKE
jgi:hypothetical protein